MNKQALLKTMLGGAIAGGALAHFLVPKKKRKKRHMLYGGVLGMAAGKLLFSVLEAKKQLDFHKKIMEFPDATSEQVKDIIDKYRRETGVKAPAFLQTEGPDFRNAIYLKPPLLHYAPAFKFVDLVTGKRPGRSQVGAPDGVFIGRNFKKIPVILHEFGHAKDYMTDHKVREGIKNFAVPAGKLTGAVLLAGGLMAGSAPTMALGAGAFLLGAGLKREAIKQGERVATNNALSFLEHNSSSDEYAKAKDLLTAAYRTYNPIGRGVSV